MIADDHHLLRYVPFSKLRKADGTDNVIGINPEAFAQRPEIDDYLSVTWEEFFSTQPHPLTSAVHAMRASLSIGKKSGFARGEVSAIKRACQARRHQIRISHEPEQNNPGHAAVRRLPVEEFELFEQLAAETWAELILNSSIP